jgi:glycosyltransferase involved in cell wall biosynthesis
MPTGRKLRWLEVASRLNSRTRPQVTVITPAYNVACYIGEAIDSVLNQTFRDFEYLVVDDGSTDRTVDEIRRRVETDSRVRLISMEHGGGARARNVGIVQAQGELVAFLDGDDRWHADFLENQLRLLESVAPGVAAVFGRSRIMSETGRIYTRRWQRAGRYDFDDMLVQSCPPRVGSSLLIKKSAFESAGLFNAEIKSAQDLDMWLRIQRYSDMPYFWGNSAYLLDVRVRTGAISRDYRTRFESLDALIGEYAPALQRYPRGMAYVRAAVYAYRAGEDAFAKRWTQLAKQEGVRRLLADTYGWRLLGWDVLGSAQRNALRRSNLMLRALIGRVIGEAGGVQR